MENVANEQQVGNAQNHREKKDASVSEMTPELQETLAVFGNLVKAGPLASLQTRPCRTDQYRARRRATSDQGVG